MSTPFDKRHSMFGNEHHWHLKRGPRLNVVVGLSIGVAVTGAILGAGTLGALGLGLGAMSIGIPLWSQGIVKHHDE
jgi:hypothetical protein